MSNVYRWRACSPADERAMYAVLVSYSDNGQERWAIVVDSTDFPRRLFRLTGDQMSSSVACEVARVGGEPAVGADVLSEAEDVFADLAGTELGCSRSEVLCLWSDVPREFVLTTQAERFSPDEDYVDPWGAAHDRDRVFDVAARNAAVRDFARWTEGRPRVPWLTYPSRRCAMGGRMVEGSQLLARRSLAWTGEPPFVICPVCGRAVRFDYRIWAVTYSTHTDGGMTPERPYLPGEVCEAIYMMESVSPRRILWEVDNWSLGKVDIHLGSADWESVPSTRAQTCPRKVRSSTSPLGWYMVGGAWGDARHVYVNGVISRGLLLPRPIPLSLVMGRGRTS